LFTNREHDAHDAAEAVLVSIFGDGEGVIVHCNFQ
jgi:hypothetical protein